MEKLENFFKELFGETANEVFFNGSRAEGLSFIIADSVWSYQIDRLVKEINEKCANMLEHPLGEWRVRQATPATIVCDVPEEFKDDCYEVRLIYAGYYHRTENDDIQEKFLAPEEFQKLRTASMPNDKLERVRDLFVFQCYTCLSYADLKVFDAKGIVEVDGKKVYKGQRAKTKLDFSVPVLPPALNILGKYQGKLPMISLVEYNACLLDVLAAAGIEKPVTTHWARQTGATLLLNAGVPIEIVSKVCGHTTVKMTERIYAKMLHTED